jgi:hypothetical protein
MATAPAAARGSTNSTVDMALTGETVVDCGHDWLHDTAHDTEKGKLHAVPKRDVHAPGPLQEP